MLRYFFIAIMATTISAATANAQYLKADVQVSGLTCSMCQKATEKALRTIGFISDVKTDLNKNVYVLTFKKGQDVQLDQIRKKVKDAGFSVSKLEATINFNNVKVGADSRINYQGTTFHLVNATSKQLNGPTKITVVDRGFVPESLYKKYTATIKSSGYKTGTVGQTRVYHVLI